MLFPPFILFSIIHILHMTSYAHTWWKMDNPRGGDTWVKPSLNIVFSGCIWCNAQARGSVNMIILTLLQPIRYLASHSGYINEILHVLLLIWLVRWMNLSRTCATPDSSACLIFHWRRIRSDSFFGWNPWWSTIFQDSSSVIDEGIELQDCRLE